MKAHSIEPTTNLKYKRNLQSLNTTTNSQYINLYNPKISRKSFTSNVNQPVLMQKRIFERQHMQNIKQIRPQSANTQGMIKGKLISNPKFPSRPTSGKVNIIYNQNANNLQSDSMS